MPSPTCPTCGGRIKRHCPNNGKRVSVCPWWRCDRCKIVIDPRDVSHTIPFGPQEVT